MKVSIDAFRAGLIKEFGKAERMMNACSQEEFLDSQKK